MPQSREELLAKKREYNARNRQRWLEAGVIEGRNKRLAERRRWRRANEPGYKNKIKAENNTPTPEKRAERNAKRRERWARAPAVERLRRAVAFRVRQSLVRTGKGGKGLVEALGYDMTTLRAHLERQFQRGMRWDNYGEWHIDHIVPMAAFKFESVDDPVFRECWALTNIRPLWASENKSKSANRTHLI